MSGGGARSADPHLQHGELLKSHTGSVEAVRQMGQSLGPELIRQEVILPERADHGCYTKGFFWGGGQAIFKISRGPPRGSPPKQNLNVG